MMKLGQMIRQEVDSQNHTVVWLARQLACSRTNVYKIFEKDSMDTNLLLRISLILKRDFFKELTARYNKEAK